MDNYEKRKIWRNFIFIDNVFRMMNLNKVIEPIEISNIVIPNRIVFPAFQTNFATPDGFVTERLTRMYEKISNGGSGLIITGCMAVSDDGVSNTNCLRLKNKSPASQIRTGGIAVTARVHI